MDQDDGFFGDEPTLTEKRNTIVNTDYNDDIEFPVERAGNKFHSSIMAEGGGGVRVSALKNTFCEFFLEM